MCPWGSSGLDYLAPLLCMDSPQPFLTEISPQPAPALDSILKLSGCGHLPPFEGCPSGPRREAWLRPGWFRIDPIFRGPTVGGQSCHPYPTPTGWTLPGEGLCQGSTAAVTEAELQGPPSSISHQRGCWAGRRPASLTSAGAGQGAVQHLSPARVLGRGPASQHLSPARVLGRGPASQETHRHGSSIIFNHKTIRAITF